MTCPVISAKRSWAQVSKRPEADSCEAIAVALLDDADESGGGASDSGRGFGVAYAYLNRRERTEAEVRARLERAEVRAEEIELVIAGLVEFGYIDDARYARVFTEDKRTLEAWGNERIARSLRERGVDRDLIEAALAEDDEPAGLGGADARGDGGRGDGGGWGDGDGRGDGGRGDGGGELDRAIALLDQRFPSGPAEPRDRQRAFGVLARKGYESETASDAVREWSRRASA